MIAWIGEVDRPGRWVTIARLPIVGLPNPVADHWAAEGDVGVAACVAEG